MSDTPVADHLFQLRGEYAAEFLEEDRTDMLYQSGEQLLFMSSKSRRDIQTLISFPKTRVKRLDKYDWGKLQIVLKYMKVTNHMKLTLIVDSLSLLNWLMDESYDKHDDCRGHTGYMMILGKGEVLS